MCAIQNVCAICNDGIMMTTLTRFESMKSRAGIRLALRTMRAARRLGVLVFNAMHETRRRQAARVIAQEWYLAGLGGAARLGSAGVGNGHR